MTLDDRSLEREVLTLFDRQADMLMQRMQNTCPANIAAAAHTLMGSARGIGAWPVARAAGEVEAAAAVDGEIAPALAVLAACLTEARVAIADLLRAH
jgi:hypothetical protein